MNKHSTLEKIKAAMKQGIGLAGKRFRWVPPNEFAFPHALFTSSETDLTCYRPDLNEYRLPAARTFRTLQELLNDQWDQRYTRGSIYGFEPTEVVKPPLDVEANPDAFWIVASPGYEKLYPTELGSYYPVDDRPAVSPEHVLRVFHVEVLQGRSIHLSSRDAVLETGLWEVVVEKRKLTRAGSSGCTVVAVQALTPSRLVETKRTLAELSPSLESRLPSMRWK